MGKRATKREKTASNYFLLISKLFIGFLLFL